MCRRSTNGTVTMHSSPVDEPCVPDGVAAAHDDPVGALVDRVHLRAEPRVVEQGRREGVGERVGARRR